MMARLVLALIAVGLLCRISVVDAACCTSGQPTYIGNSFNMRGVPTCSDGPCTGNGFDYLASGGAESPDPTSCCAIDKDSGFSYNPKAGSDAQWPDYRNFPKYYAGTGLTCDAQKPRYSCTISGTAVPGNGNNGNNGKSKNNTKKFSLRHLLM